MNYNNSGNSQKELVDNLAKNGLLPTPILQEAMRAVDRKHFVDAKEGPLYEDKPRNISPNATITSPHMHAIGLEALLGGDEIEKVKISKSKKRALDVGCGSGYVAACLAYVLDPLGGMTYGIDHCPYLVAISRKNCAASLPQFTESKTLSFYEGDGFLGLEEMGPYDYIHVGAAVEMIPASLVQQLAVGGSMVIPVGPIGGEQDLIKVTRNSSGVSRETIMRVVYSRMEDEPPKLENEKQKELEDEAKQLFEEMEVVTKDLRKWQDDYKTKYGMKPSITVMTQNDESAYLLRRFTELKKALKVTKAQMSMLLANQQASS